MITAQIKSNIKLPRMNSQKDLEFIAERIFIPKLSEGIHANRSIDGGKFPALDQKTIDRKGHSRPLIDTGTLDSAFVYKRSGKYSVIISIRSDRKDIGKYLQIDGIRTKSGKKYFNFFGVSKEMETRAMEYMKQRIAEVIKRA